MGVERKKKRERELEGETKRGMEFMRVSRGGEKGAREGHERDKEKKND